MFRFILYPLIFTCSFNENAHSHPRTSYSENMKSKIKSSLGDKENIQIQKKNNKNSKNKYFDGVLNKKIPSFYYDIDGLIELKNKNIFLKNKNNLEKILNVYLSVEDSFVVSMLDIALKSSLNNTFKDATLAVRTKKLLRYIPVPEVIRSIGMGVFERLSLAINSLKESYPDPVLHPDYQNKLLEPALIYAGLKRADFKLINKKLEIFEINEESYLSAEDLNLLKQDSIEKNDAMERLKSFRKQQAAIFSLPDNVSPLDVEASVWNEMFVFFRNRKREIDNSNHSKITPAEILNKFSESVVKYYTGLDYEDYTLYYRPDLFSLDDPINFEGDTNIELLLNGNAPIGLDGKPMNFHHLTHHDPGVIVLLSKTFHQVFSGDLHYAHRHYRRPSAVYRPSFDKNRKAMAEALGIMLESENESLEEDELDDLSESIDGDITMAN